MKIGRIEWEGAPTWVGSENDKDFYRLTASPFEEGCLTTEKVDFQNALTPLEPPQIFCIGLNYRKHAAEFNNPIPEYPVIFHKSITSILEPGGKIQIPQYAGATFVDYEVELAIVIGKKTSNVSKEDALDYVLGYTIANDVTSRDWQKGTKGGGQWCRAKSFDTFCPLGPWIVTKDELTDPNNLQLESFVNGESRQRSNTSDMIFPVQELVSFLSQNTTLLPGTIILTGTPSGVGAGLDPKVRLKSGDEVKLVIEGIGELVNVVG